MPSTFDMKPNLTWTRRSALKTIAAGTGAALAAPYVRRARADETLFINTWGGSWEDSARRNIFDPFTAETGIPIQTVSPVSVAKLAAQVQSGSYEFDVTTLGAGDLLRANEADLIEPITPESAAGLGLWDGAVFQNAVASHAFATMIAYRKDKFPNGGPTNWAEFWDVEKFPGTRSLQRYAARILPIALAADGVPTDQLYPLDLDRAFAALDRIKEHVRVWWTQGPQAGQLIRDGEVDLIGIWNQTAGDVIDAGQPLELVWNQAQIERAYWVVAKGTPRAENAWKYIKFATSPKILAAFCKEASYGPLNPAAFELISPDDARLMPTSPEHKPLTFEQDILNLGTNVETMTRRFDRWLST